MAFSLLFLHGLRILFLFLFSGLEIMHRHLVAKLRIDVFERPLTGFWEARKESAYASRQVRKVIGIVIVQEVNDRDV